MFFLIHTYGIILRYILLYACTRLLFLHHYIIMYTRNIIIILFFFLSFRGISHSHQTLLFAYPFLPTTTKTRRRRPRRRWRRFLPCSTYTYTYLYTAGGKKPEHKKIKLYIYSNPLPYLPAAVFFIVTRGILLFFFIPVLFSCVCVRARMCACVCVRGYTELMNKQKGIIKMYNE